MNILYLICLIAVLISAFANTTIYLKERDAFLKSGKAEQPKSLTKARNACIYSVIVAIVVLIFVV